MGTVATADELVVSLAAGVDKDPEVAAAIAHATNDLRGLLRQHHIDPARRELVWEASVAHPIDYVVVDLKEVDKYGTRQARGTFTRRWLLDPVIRKMGVINLLLDVRGRRSSQVNAVIDRGIAELERQEEANGNRD